MNIRGATRLLVPGLVLQAVMVGGGYSTGRELVSFFLVNGPASAIAGMAVTAMMFSLTAMLAFELARRNGAFDYKTFCQIFMGRWWFLFEIGYIGALLLTLSVVTAAAGELVLVELGLAPLAGACIFIIVISILLLLDTSWIERIISFWSLLFYAAYGAMFLAVFWLHGDAMMHSIGARPLDVGQSLSSGLSYTGYNITLVAILIFVARTFRSRKEALIAGAITGPLMLLPGIALLLTLTAFYPAILHSPLPVSHVLNAVGNPLLSSLINIIISCALMKTGLAMLHGLNERIGAAYAARGTTMPRFARPALAIGAMIFAGAAAASIGLIDLIGKGYRYSGYYFLAVFLLPLFTRGVWLVTRRPAQLSSREHEA